MTPRPILSALVLSPLLLALSPRAADISFHPSDGSAVTRAYSIEMDFELGDLTMMLDGQDMSEMVSADVDGSAELVMKVTERFVRSSEGRPLELIRSFLEMRGEAVSNGESSTLDEFEALEGKSVRFLWNEEEEDYDISFHESEGDDSEIENLTPDMDLRALLPDKQVEVGDTWSVDARQLENVLLFGSTLPSGDEEFDELFEAEIKPQLEGLLDDFSTSCEFKGERESDGRKLAVIGVKMHGEGVVDLAPVILAAIEQNAGDMEIDIDIDVADLTLAFDAEGEMLWDLERGHLHAFQMEGEAQLAFEASVHADAAGESHSIEADAEVLADGSWKVAPAQD